MPIVLHCGHLIFTSASLTSGDAILTSLHTDLLTKWDEREIEFKINLKLNVQLQLK